MAQVPILPKPPRVRADPGGSLTMAADGDFTYAAASGSAYTAYFTVTVSNGTQSALEDVFVHVSVQPPEVTSTNYTATIGQTLQTSASETNGVLNYAFDPNGGTLTVTAVNGNTSAIGQQITLGSGSTLTMQADGNFAYTPRAGGAFNETFTVTVSNGSQSATGNVYINVAMPDTVTENTSGKVVTGPLSHLLQNSTSQGASKFSSSYLFVVSNDTNEDLGLPSNTVLPSRDPEDWTGPVGNSNFRPRSPRQFRLQSGEEVPFRNGRPNFDQWAIAVPGSNGRGNVRTFTVPGLGTGANATHENDRPLIIAELGRRLGHTTVAQTRRWLRGRILHHVGGNRVQVVPERINQGVSHTGGRADNARRVVATVVATVAVTAVSQLFKFRRPDGVGQADSLSELLNSLWTHGIEVEWVGIEAAQDLSGTGPYTGGRYHTPGSALLQAAAGIQQLRQAAEVARANNPSAPASTGFISDVILGFSTQLDVNMAARANTSVNTQTVIRETYWLSGMQGLIADLVQLNARGTIRSSTSQVTVQSYGLGLLDWVSPSLLDSLGVSPGTRTITITTFTPNYTSVNLDPVLWSRLLALNLDWTEIRNSLNTRVWPGMTEEQRNRALASVEVISQELARRAAERAAAEESRRRAAANPETARFLQALQAFRNALVAGEVEGNRWDAVSMNYPQFRAVGYNGWQTSPMGRFQRRLIEIRQAVSDGRMTASEGYNSALAAINELRDIINRMIHTPMLVVQGTVRGLGGGVGLANENIPRILAALEEMLAALNVAADEFYNATMLP
jgi:hypothetical protein